MSQPNSAPVWKQEVNRRLAAHKSRSGPALARQEAPAEACHGINSRAAQAAARVAARYANAPSFSQMQAAEARSALHAAPAATQAAGKAQAVAEGALTGLEAAWIGHPRPAADLPFVVRQAEAGEPARQLMAEPAAPPTCEPEKPQPLEIRWEPDMPQRPVESAEMHVSHGEPSYEAAAEDSWRQGSPEIHALGITELEPVEPGQPIHANLIEFPRELVAARRVHTRLADGSFAPVEDCGGQLSIFEVDPDAILSQHAAQASLAQPEVFQWAGIELEAQSEEEIELEPDPLPAATSLQLAPFSRRLMAAVVDGALIAAAFLAAALTAAMHIEQLPQPRVLEAGAALALLFTGWVYLAVFSALAEATPGMRYAGISLCTFDEQVPTRGQRCERLGALFLSVMPVGLGVVWGIFDEDHLSWHDRLSKTYQRKC